MKFPLKTISIATGLVIAFGAVSAVSFSFGKAHAMPGASAEAAAATEPAGAAIAPDEDPDLVFGRPIALEEEPADEALRALPADGPAPEMTQLPAELKKLARRLKVNPREVVISVRPLDAPGRTLLGVNDGVLEKPASTEKLVTTLAALETLGPAWRWRTGFYAAAAPDAEGVLKGGLFVRGGGDPTFVIEDFALEVERLAQLGVRRIEGDVTIDRSYFNIPDVNSSAFDGRGARPYNLPPDAALVNYRSLSVELIPDEAAGVARVVSTPRLAGIVLPETVPLKPGKCGKGRSAPGFRLRKGEGDERIVEFTGTFTAACGASRFVTISFTPDEYFERTFRALWERDGRTWTGRAVSGAVPEGARRLLTRESPTVIDVIALTNKWSNNMMARHILLTLGAERVRRAEGRAKGAAFPRGATLEDGRAAVADWMRRRGVPEGEIQIDNGSGLSRESRVTARAMSRVLAAGWTGPYMPEFLASLPISGRDGTMRRRKVAVSEGRIKTGFLADVRSIGGYVHARDGSRWAVYASVRGKSAINGGIPFLNGLIDWIDRGRK